MSNKIMCIGGPMNEQFIDLPRGPYFKVSNISSCSSIFAEEPICIKEEIYNKEYFAICDIPVYFMVHESFTPKEALDFYIENIYMRQKNRA